MLTNYRVLAQQRGAREPRTTSCAQQCQLHRISAVFVRYLSERGIVAEAGDFQEAAQLRVISQPDALSIAARSGIRRAGVDLACRNPEAPDGHAVFRQGSGLVGEDDSGRPKRLDR